MPSSGTGDVSTARAAEISTCTAARARTSTVFFFQAEDGIRDLTVTGVQTCALPISCRRDRSDDSRVPDPIRQGAQHGSGSRGDRKSTRLNSSHSQISYAVFCLKKKTSLACASLVRSYQM